jgi:hypothetical protein
VESGRVKVVFWDGNTQLARSIAESADGMVDWPGLTRPFTDTVTILLATDRAAFDSLTLGRLPEWGAAGAFPSSNTLVLRNDLMPFEVLGHEMAHLALHSNIPHTPLWFSEGYAVWAAGEWERMDVLRVNLALVSGRVPTLTELSRQLREGRARANSAYALAATVVVELYEVDGENGMRRLLDEYGESGDLNTALRSTFLITVDQFEELWMRRIDKRYGWLSFLTSFGAFWLVVVGSVGLLWLKRRRVDRIRRADLDHGWVIADESDEVDAGIKED